MLKGLMVVVEEIGDETEGFIRDLMYANGRSSSKQAVIHERCCWRVKGRSGGIVPNPTLALKIGSKAPESIRRADFSTKVPIHSGFQDL
jgi:hypothetical protein